MTEQPQSWPTLPGAVPPPMTPHMDPLHVARPVTLAPHEPAAEQSAQKVPCPVCGVAVAAWESFCEACGSPLAPTAPAPVSTIAGTERAVETGTTTTPTAPMSKQTEREDLLAQAVVEPQSHTCTECGGVVGPDAYCTQCGAKAIDPRQHFTEAPVAWLAGVCDRGIRHDTNEDAMALWAIPGTVPGAGVRAAVVVCDGVSTSDESDVAALAGARGARAVLTERTDWIAAVEAANEAVIAATDPTSRNAASCTLVGAALDGCTLTYANLGDSRAYWLPDAGEAVLLTEDHSLAQARIAMGVPREDAENGPQAHAITKWLGRDADDISPRVGTLEISQAGFVLVCTDGLWNYCTQPTRLAELVRQEAMQVPDGSLVALCERLVAWANRQGGRDNITVALLRCAGPAATGVDNLDESSATKEDAQHG